MSLELKPGDLVPDISLKNQDGATVRLRDFVGKSALVIYFYPKDDTPGCTMEACSFRDSYEDFADRGAKVFGISSDSVAAHQKFKERNRLNFNLLSDSKKIAQKAFAVPRTFMGLIPGRVTYIFDRDGKLLSTFNSSVQARRHISEALKTLRLDSEAT